MTSHGDFILATYDHVIDAAAGDGMKVGEARAEVADALAAAIRGGDIEPIEVGEYARRATAQVVDRMRDTRRTRLPKIMERVADVLAGNTILEPEDDPLLRLAYAVGDKTDKALIYWTQDDWQTAIVTRYRQAAEATAAAALFDGHASAIIALIGGDTLGAALHLP